MENQTLFSLDVKTVCWLLLLMFELSFALFDDIVMLWHSRRCHLNFMWRPYFVSFFFSLFLIRYRSNRFVRDFCALETFRLLVSHFWLFGANSVWNYFMWIWLKWGHALRFHKTDDLLKCMVYLMRSLSKSTFQSEKSAFFSLTHSLNRESNLNGRHSMNRFVVLNQHICWNIQIKSN